MSRAWTTRHSKLLKVGYPLDRGGDGDLREDRSPQFETDRYGQKGLDRDVYHVEWRPVAIDNFDRAD